MMIVTITMVRTMKTTVTLMIMINMMGIAGVCEQLSSPAAGGEHFQRPQDLKSSNITCSGCHHHHAVEMICYEVFIEGDDDDEEVLDYDQNMNLRSFQKLTLRRSAGWKTPCRFVFTK